jgi:hypothetical protein
LFRSSNYFFISSESAFKANNGKGLSNISKDID